MASRELNPKHKREMKRVIRKIQTFLNNMRIYPRRQVLLDNVVLAHVSKGLKVAQAVMCLIEADLPEEAFGLSRTLVEVAFNLRFITNRYSERRAKRFVGYFARWKLEQIRRAIKHFTGGKDKRGRNQPKYTKTELRRQVPQYKLVAKLARKFPSRTSWTETRNRQASRGGTWKMAVEPDRYEKVDGQPVRWEFDYDWIYFWTSQYVHATAVCMDSHFPKLEKAFSIHVSPEQGKHTAGLAVFNTGLFLSKILVMAFRAIRYDSPDELLKPLGEVLNDMANEELVESNGADR
jgi:hypothetical protein